MEGRLLIFAGQRWEVTSVDQDKQIAFLKKASGGNVPLFGGEGALVHTRVRKQMYETYTKTSIPKYLDSKGCELLEEGRTHFDRLDLQDRHIVPQGERTVLFLWTGDRIVNTMYVLLSQKDYQVSKTGMTLELQHCGPEELLEELQRIVSSEPPKPSQLAKSVENTIVDKHDRYLPDNLLNANYVSKRLDIKGALRVAKDITKMH